jgi:hypothetical protein
MFHFTTQAHDDARIATRAAHERRPAEAAEVRTPDWIFLI